MQIAQALEAGASGVLVLACAVGSDLRVLLDAGTIMGAEVIVEVHTPNELEYALQCGATTFIVNTRDRTTNVQYPHQVMRLACTVNLYFKTMLFSGKSACYDDASKRSASCCCGNHEH